MRILIVDAEKESRIAYAKLIMEAGFKIVSVGSAEDALNILEKEHFNMMITDVVLPGDDGITLTQTLRDSGNQLPILITSRQHTQRSIDAGLRAGADDYMLKPVEAEEFLLRIKAILRRSRLNTNHVITIGSTTIDSHTMLVSTEQGKFTLPYKEFHLLFFLLSYPNQVFSREYLLNEIWGPDTDSEPVTVSVHINRLRKRFEGNKNFTIMTCRGSGYKACTSTDIK